MKKAYTLVELIIVILIIGVLMVAFRNVFQMNNKDSLYGEACVNNLYGDVSNYLYSAITSKALYSGTEKIFPDAYFINFSTTTNTITLKYKEAGKDIQTGRLLDLVNTVPQNYNCKNQSYQMILSGEDIELKINKGLTEDGDLRSMTLSGGGLFTGDIKFIMTYPPNTGYVEVGKFNIDIRTQNIRKTVCLNMGDEGICEERN